MISMRIPSGRLLVALFVLGVMLAAITPPRARAQEAQTAPKPAAPSTADAASPAPSRTPDPVLASLNRAMTW